MAKAKATYTVVSWDEKPVLEREDGEKLTRATVTGSYEGDLEGEGRSESVMWYRPDGTAEYVALERIKGSLGDRRGSFVVRATGDYDGTNARSRWQIVEDSGTDDLEGLTGSGSFEAPPGHQGSIELDYE